ncbi:succinyl-diaminopimelate desuccinylase [Vibrio xiamenensis]|uniref:Succinyl-diaminopimelate desuccinylase n=1 Tax=Vibrio xiamenensis TaxID=861298 RepID=A0A1G8FZL6_9VIBR|nr:M20/M25/M40 family metallo-hydrolase [Vibrio xiamenensis]SDH87577.1 succinyl-diaminopimelate desuccinylase [Vibrio xiamenensis]
MDVNARLAQALQHIDSDRQAVTEDLRHMLALDTCFPPGNGYGDFATLMEKILTPMGFSTERVSVPDTLWQTSDGQVYGERVNLIATRPQVERESCHLYFHVDTVPPGDGWTFAPLQLTEADGRFYGRGAADMKGTIVAALAALRAIDAHKLPLKFSPSLLLCTDEEGGLYPGIRYLAEQGHVDGHIVNFNGGALARIWGGCFGSVDLSIRIYGHSTHSGEPLGAINAIEESLPLMNALYELKQKVEQRVSAMPAPPHFNGEPLRSRLTIAAAHGGSKGSTIPAKYELLINRRYAPEESFDEVMQELLACIESAMASSKALRVEHEIIGHLAPVSDPTGPNQPRWQAAQSLGFGYPLESFKVWGSSTSSDMGWVQQAGVKEMMLGGLARPDNHIHAADEYTTFEDIASLAKAILAYLVEDFAPPTGI